MDMIFEISPDGQLIVRVEEGDFEGAKLKIEAALGKLAASGVKWEGEPKIERHTHGPEKRSVRLVGRQSL